MVFFRGAPLLILLTTFGSSTCRGKNDEPPPSTGATAVDVTLPDVDTSALTPRERRDFAAQASELLAPCPDVPVSLAQCVKEKRPCRTCLPAAQFLLKQVQGGRAKKDREEAVQARFDPKRVKTVVIDGSPAKGSPDAVVTIVEWADFECPFCKLVYPILDSLVDRFDGQVRAVFKFYPLQGHPHGEVAARAAAAAHAQGKFWEMHHVMFDNQERLERSDLESYAKQLKLDRGEFLADMISKATEERIVKDKRQGEELGLSGTPMIFINGREVDLKQLVDVSEDLEAWVRLEIELSGQTPKAVPSAAPKAPPALSASAMGPAAPTSSAAASGSASSGRPEPKK